MLFTRGSAVTASSASDAPLIAANKRREGGDVPFLGLSPVLLWRCMVVVPIPWGERRGLWMLMD